MQIKGSTNKEG